MFGQLADEVIEGKSTEWRNEMHRRQWKMTLVEYAATIRSRPVNEIETEDVLGVLRFLWLKRPETASRLPTVPLSCPRLTGSCLKNFAERITWARSL
jgi:hypothetical protein